MRKKEIDGNMEDQIVNSSEEIGMGLAGIVIACILIIAMIVGIPFLIATQLYR